MYSYIPSSGSHTCDLLCGLGSLGEQQEPDDHNVYLYLTAWSSTMRTYGRSTQFIRAFIVRVTPVYTVRTYERTIYRYAERETTGDINNLEELTATYTPKGSGVDLREKGVYLAHHPTHQGTWALLAQTGISRRFVYSI